MVYEVATNLLPVHLCSKFMNCLCTGLVTCPTPVVFVYFGDVWNTGRANTVYHI